MSITHKFSALITKIQLNHNIRTNHPNTKYKLVTNRSFQLLGRHSQGKTSQHGFGNLNRGETRKFARDQEQLKEIRKYSSKGAIKERRQQDKDWKYSIQRVKEVEKQFYSKIGFYKRPVLTRLASYSQHCSDTILLHLVLRRIPSTNYMCAQDIHTTHIATNMENIKNNALLYIEHNYNRIYNYYRSIEKLFLIFSLGLYTPQGRLTGGVLAQYSWKISCNSSFESTIWYPSMIFVDCM